MAHQVDKFAGSQMGSGGFNKGGNSYGTIDNAAEAYAAKMEEQQPDFVDAMGVSHYDEPEWKRQQTAAALRPKAWSLWAPDLLHAMQVLRAKAVNKKLDMTDAFEEYAGSGLEKNIGVMDKARFFSTMGLFFAGSISLSTLETIAELYPHGDPDPGGSGHTQVQWKQFAIDFDEVPLLPPPEAPAKADKEFLAALQQLRVSAASKRLDMTDAFEEYAGTGSERNSGVMTKNRFRSTLGTLFRGNLSTATLDEICRRYGTGEADPREAGSFRQVRWKQFAIDFDEVPLPGAPPLPDPTPEILEAMREMNVYCNLNAIDLAEEFENYMGGKDKCTSDLMPREKFKQALGVLLGRPTSLYPHTQETLEAICKAYAGGAPVARDPRIFELVQWREFALDVNRIQPQPFLEGLQGEVVFYPQKGQLGHDTYEWRATQS